jgi:hypothetical protein
MGVGNDNATGTNTLMASSMDEHMEIDQKGTSTSKGKNKAHRFTPLDTKDVRFNLTILN